MTIVRLLKKALKAQYEKKINLKPIFRNPYASHLPVLIAMGYLTKPKSVLEYGSGVYSTSVFLRSDAFPELREIKSFENDPAWYSQMNVRLAQDSRATLEFVEGRIETVVSRSDMERSDLVFIDDSINLERTLTIKAVAAAKIGCIPIVIHDVNIRHYRWPTRRFENRFVFDALNPQTGVVWNGSWPASEHLSVLNSIIANHSGALEPDDAGAWLQVFRAGCPQNRCA